MAPNSVSAALAALAFRPEPGSRAGSHGRSGGDDSTFALAPARRTERHSRAWPTTGMRPFPPSVPIPASRRLPAAPLRRAHREPLRLASRPRPMTSIKRVAIVHRDLSLLGSLGRDAFLLVRELVDLGIDVHVYCDPASRAAGLEGATFHDVRPLVRSSSRAGRALELASFAAAATRTVHADARRRPYDIVDVNSVSAWGQDVVRVHEVVRAGPAALVERGGSRPAPRTRPRRRSSPGAPRARRPPGDPAAPVPARRVRRRDRRVRDGARRPRRGARRVTRPDRRRSARRHRRPRLARHPVARPRAARRREGRAAAALRGRRVPPQGTTPGDRRAGRTAARHEPHGRRRRPATASCAKRSVAPSRRASRSASISSAATRRRGTTRPPTCSSSRPRMTCGASRSSRRWPPGFRSSRRGPRAARRSWSGPAPASSSTPPSRASSATRSPGCSPTRLSARQWDGTAASPRRASPRGRGQSSRSRRTNGSAPPGARRAVHRAARQPSPGSRPFPPSSR